MISVVASGLAVCSKGGLFGYQSLPNHRNWQNWVRYGTLKVEAVVKRSPKRLKYAAAGIRKGSSVAYVQVDPSASDIWKLDSIVELIKGGAVGVIPTDTVYAIVCDLKNRESIDRLYRIKDMDSKKVVFNPVTHLFLVWIVVCCLGFYSYGYDQTAVLVLRQFLCKNSSPTLTAASSLNGWLGQHTTQPLSILCRSFQDIDTYTMGFPRGNSHGQTNVFRAARQCLPGPYTFILPASKDMPKQCTTFGGSAAVSCAPRKSVGVRMPNDEICKAILERLDEPLLCTSVRQPAADQWMLDPVIISDTYGAVVGKEGLDFVVDGGVRVADPSTVVDMTGMKPLVLRTGKGIIEEWMLLEQHDSNNLVKVGGLQNPYA